MEQEKVKQIINSLKNEFSSRDFIKKFASTFEREYIDMLHDSKAEKIFQSVHQQIGRYLSVHHAALEIESVGKEMSENIFGNMSEVESWIKKS